MTISPRLAYLGAPGQLPWADAPAACCRVPACSHDSLGRRATGSSALKTLLAIWKRFGTSLASGNQQNAHRHGVFRP